MKRLSLENCIGHLTEIVTEVEKALGVSQSRIKKRQLRYTLEVFSSVKFHLEQKRKNEKVCDDLTGL
jgi:CHAD domain-containing protein